MSRRRKDPLRALSDGERASLEQAGRAASAPAGVVARARALLAVADGCSYAEAARRVGRRSGDAVAGVVARFNLAEVRRVPDRERDGTATWSLGTLQRALRRAEDGLPQVSTYTIWRVLHEADLSWQRDRSWCHTGRRSGAASRAKLRCTTRTPARKKADRAGVHSDSPAGVGAR